MKTQNRILTILLTLTMLLSIMMVPALASEKANVTVETVSQEVEVGTTVELDVTISNNPGYYGFVWEIEYDNTKLQLKDILLEGEKVIVNGKEYTDPLLAYNATVRISDDMISWSDAEKETGNGVMFILVFNVLANAEPGEAVVGIKSHQFSAYNNAEVPATYIAGGITIAEPPVPEHEHDWADGWMTNEIHHWHECEAADCPITEDADKDGYGSHTDADGKWNIDSTKHWHECKCGKVLDEAVHETEHKEAKDADCGNAGNVEYWYCSGCGKYFTDETLTEEVDEDELTIPATGDHVYDDDGKCTVCGAQKPGEGSFPWWILGAVGHPFDDIVGHWAEEAMVWAYGNDLMNGTSEDTFSPEVATTRAMIWTILARMDGVNTDGGATWYEKGQSWAMANGVSDGTNPMGQINREQLVTMIYRYCGSPVAYGALSGYSDAGSVSAWAKDAMTWAVNTGLINGIAGGLAPQASASRAQVATILMRWMG